MAIQYFQGDQLIGSIGLRQLSAVAPTQQDPWAIPAGSVIKVLFPGTSATVMIDSSTAVAPEFGGGFEVSVTSLADAILAFNLIPAKGAGVKLSANAKTAQPINVVVYDSMGAQIQTFEISSGIICTARANT